MYVSATVKVSIFVSALFCLHWTEGVDSEKENTCTLAAKVFREKVLPDIKSSPYSLCACG